MDIEIKEAIVSGTINQLKALRGMVRKQHRFFIKEVSITEKVENGLIALFVSLQVYSDDGILYRSILSALDEALPKEIDISVHIFEN